MDGILVQGNNMYLHSYNNNLIPRDDLLSVNNLPTVIDANTSSVRVEPVVMIKDMEPFEAQPFEAQTKTSDLPIVVEPFEAQPFEAQTKTSNLPIVVEPFEVQTKTSDLPIVVEPFEAQPFEAQTKTSDLPIVVEPFEAQPFEAQTKTSDLPIVVEPYEAQPFEAQTKTSNLPIVVEPLEALNEKQRWFIKYGKDHQGLIRSDYELGTPYFTIHSALMNTFTPDNYAILILGSYMTALIKDLDSSFYLFDAHARNGNGMPDPNGTAVVMKYSSLSEVEEHICSLSSELNTNLFEVVPVQFKQAYNAKKK